MAVRTGHSDDCGCTACTWATNKPAPSGAGPGHLCHAGPLQEANVQVARLTVALDAAQSRVKELEAALRHLLDAYVSPHLPETASPCRYCIKAAALLGEQGER